MLLGKKSYALIVAFVLILTASTVVQASYVYGSASGRKRPIYKWEWELTAGANVQAGPLGWQAEIQTERDSDERYTDLETATTYTDDWLGFGAKWVDNQEHAQNYAEAYGEVRYGSFGAGVIQTYRLGLDRDTVTRLRGSFGKSWQWWRFKPTVSASIAWMKGTPTTTQAQAEIAGLAWGDFSVVPLLRWERRNSSTRSQGKVTLRMAI